jgi:hypothetical protein
MFLLMELIEARMTKALPVAAGVKSFFREGAAAAATTTDCFCCGSKLRYKPLRSKWKKKNKEK